MFPDFLNKPEKRKFLFVNYLENCFFLNEDKETMMNDLQMSNFLFHKTIEELNTDFVAFAPQEEVKIVLKGSLVHLNAKAMISSEVLFAHYLGQSMRYCIFKECFFEQLVSIYEFAEHHYFSHNPVYKEFKILKSILLYYDIQVNKNFQLVVVGEEWKVREFLFVFLLSSKEESKRLFPLSTRKIVRNFRSYFADTAMNCGTDARMTIKLSLLLNIVVTRIKNGHSLGSSKPKGHVIPVAPPLLHKIAQWVHSIDSMQSKYSCHIEAEGIAQFLIAEGLIDGTSFVREGRPEIADMNAHFLAHLLEYFPIDTEVVNKIDNELYSIHYLFTSINLSQYWHYVEADIEQLIENYPEFATFCKAYIQVNLALDPTCLNSQYLFHQYLTLLVSLIPIKDILTPINICVDTSYGEKYNRIIALLMKNYIDTPINVQHNVYMNTEVIISDVMNHDLLCSIFLHWSKSPRQSDWQNLKVKINIIRMDRMDQVIAARSFKTKNAKNQLSL